MNHLVLAGRLAEDPKVEILKDGNSITTITLAIPRNYKNSEGVYETDFVKCNIWKGIAEAAKDYCRKGDIIGVRGRIQSKVIKDENGNDKEIQVNVAEKITFITTRGQPKKNMER